jgi:hypothetical protein
MPTPSNRSECDMEQASPTRHRVALVLIGTLLLFTLAVLPFAVQGVVRDLVQPQSAQIYHLTPHDTPPAATHSRLHIDLIALDEWQGAVRMRVSGTHVCHPACAWNDKFLFVSTFGHGEPLGGLPPSAAVTFPPTAMETAQVIELPITGQPIRYPFDAYQLRLGVILQRVFPDGSVQGLSPEQAQGHLFLSVHPYLQREILQVSPLAPEAARLSEGAYQYVALAVLTFTRPRYLQIETLLLVLLISTIAVYAVVIQPFPQLITSAGALVLGVWGIRAILVGTDVPGITALDLALAVVILFLLVAVAVRALAYHAARSGLPWFQRTLDPARMDSPTPRASQPPTPLTERTRQPPRSE